MAGGAATCATHWACKGNQGCGFTDNKAEWAYCKRCGSATSRRLYYARVPCNGPGGGTQGEGAGGRRVPGLALEVEVRPGKPRGKKKLAKGGGAQPEQGWPRCDNLLLMRRPSQGSQWTSMR